MKDLLEKKFNNGLTPEAFEERLGEHEDLHRHHYKRTDIERLAGDMIDRQPAFNVLIITEPWCGDSLAVVPVLLKFFEKLDDVDVRFVLRDENHDIMEHYLTNGGMAIPKIIVMDTDFNELFNFGPRPKDAQEIFDKHRSAIKKGTIEKADVHKLIRAFYARSKGQAIMDEFLGELEKHLS